MSESRLGQRQRSLKVGASVVPIASQSSSTNVLGHRCPNPAVRPTSGFGLCQPWRQLTQGLPTEYGGVTQVIGPQERYETSSPYPHAPPPPWGGECRLHEDRQQNVRCHRVDRRAPCCLPRIPEEDCHTQGVPAR
ncbi:hypothetical protein PSTG_15880 [Puccinia striiformis f. sp. tritici PST-78]|uniref:Uncharacterized protein n=1 Tax=Puccinia striiformis f. sp. tritici PST-78 TaxID=1165861 RepID=A0A0L0UUG1_9BASI|nr:hypothetical protein PSTG_15880 [Puccinia striiformis f. sp. tritici PST-78]